MSHKEICLHITYNKYYLHSKKSHNELYETLSINISIKITLIIKEDNSSNVKASLKWYNKI